VTLKLCRISWLAIAVGVSLASSHVILGADQPSADAALKSHGLKRIGITYVLTSEGEFQKKISEARLESRKLAALVNQQRAFEQGIEGGKALGQELLQQRISLNQQLSEVDRQMDAFGAANPVERNQLVAEHNQLVASLNIVTDRLNLLNSQRADSKWKQDLDAEVSRGRAAYIQTVLSLRELADRIVNQYDELVKNDEVQQALRAAGSTSKTALKLGPSREFLANIKLLGNVEKSVITEEVALKRMGGVYEIDVTINGKMTVPMVFDTGASFTTISTELALRIGLNPDTSDEVISLKVADGSIIKAKRMIIPSLRIGKFTVTDVECTVMPPDKRDVPPLLGQSFLRHFTFKVTGDSGRLIVSKVETGDPTATKPARTTTTDTKTRRNSRSKSSVKKPSIDAFGNTDDRF
jgi:clan AA aspartic protease (TIGR02281 family)